MEEKPYFTAGIPQAKPTSKTPVARASAQDMQMLQGIKLHSSSPSEGLVSMSDSKGNRQWVKAGRNIEGWNVHSIHPSGSSVIMERNGAFVPMPIQGSAPTEYVSPVTKEKITGTGTMSDKEQALINTFAFEGDPTQYILSPEEFAKSKNDSISKGYISDANLNYIVHFDEYKKMAETGKLENGKRYYIPRKSDDGNIDFDIFTPSDESE